MNNRHVSDSSSRVTIKEEAKHFCHTSKGIVGQIVAFLNSLER